MLHQTRDQIQIPRCTTMCALLDPRCILAPSATDIMVFGTTDTFICPTASRTDISSKPLKLHAADV